jgi:hypothetical protein
MCALCLPEHVLTAGQRIKPPGQLIKPPWAAHQATLGSASRSVAAPPPLSRREIPAREHALYARAGAAMLIACTTTQPLTRLRAQLNGFGEHITWVDIGDLGANPGRLIHAISRFADEHPGQSTWCVQEAAWPVRSTPELREVIRHEALINLALKGQVRILCPYHASLPPEVIASAQATHPLVGHDDIWHASPRYEHAIPAECDEPLPPPPAGCGSSTSSATSSRCAPATTEPPFASTCACTPSPRGCPGWQDHEA